MPNSLEEEVGFSDVIVPFWSSRHFKTDIGLIIPLLATQAAVYAKLYSSFEYFKSMGLHDTLEYLKSIYLTN